MDSYNYLVHGERQVLKDLQKTTTTTTSETRRRYGIRLDPGAHEKLVTLRKVWSLDGGNSGLLGDTADEGNRLKDVCLSFALYKLQRRRFYDLPVHEARLSGLALQGGNKMRRLVSDYILHDVERAFRVVATEVSFLQDYFYSKHATQFADGFPAKNLVLSLLLVAATGYIAYPVRNIDENTDVDYHTHGVLITRLMIALIVLKELAEVYMYVFSQWAKVLALCSYATNRCLRRHPLLEGAMRALLLVMTRDRWDEKIRQHNLLISTRAVKVKLPLPLPAAAREFTWDLRSKYSRCIKMQACTKKAIFKSVKRLLADNDNRRSLLARSSYLSNALGPRLQWLLELEADTHMILVWHIATALCEIDLASDTAVALRPFFMWPRPFVKEPAKAITNELGDHGSSSKHGDSGVELSEHYATAASLSNYCAYLVAQKLVPDNGFVSVKVLHEVSQEIIQVTMDGSIGFRSMRDIFDRLMHADTTTANMKVDVEAPMDAGPPETETETETETVTEAPNIITNSLTSKGAKLAKQLMVIYKEDKASLWEKLAEFWTEFLLHLAASTRASKHKTGLAGRRELITHIWALLSHAGYASWTDRGQKPMDPADRDVLRFANQT